MNTTSHTHTLCETVNTVQYSKSFLYLVAGGDHIKNHKIISKQFRFSRQSSVVSRQVSWDHPLTSFTNVTTTSKSAVPTTYPVVDVLLSGGGVLVNTITIEYTRRGELQLHIGMSKYYLWYHSVLDRYWGNRKPR